MRRLSRALAGLAFTVVVGGIVVGVCLAALLPGLGIVTSAAEYDTELVTDLRVLSQRSTVYDSAGNQIGELGLENRQNVSFDEVPQVVIDAVVATEDKTFWENDGIDLSAVARAALKNLTSGEITQGGSTISQQLVKNRILSPQRDLKRKIREVLLARELNKDYSKREILEQYLNTVYFGQGSYGIKSAVERMLVRPDPANTFCGCRGESLETVSVADAAMLAGIIQSPGNYNPFLNPGKTIERRSFVLSQMLEEGYIEPEQLAEAEQVPLPSIAPSTELRPEDAWVEEVQDRLFTDPRYSVLGATREARENAVLRGGLKIYATKDPNAQFNAQSAVDRSLPPTDFTASLVAIDPATGAVRAMVAGPGFEDSQYNIATSPVGRQAGSTWKIVTLSAAMQARFTANDRVDGSGPCEFGSLGATSNYDGAGGGVTTVRGATVGSINCAFARIQLAVGFPKVIDMAKKLGITQNTLAPILTLTLGTIESTPLEMATVAASIASGGLRHDSYFVERIENPEGIVIYQEQHPGLRVLDEEAAACTIDILRGVTKGGGTGTGAAVPGWDVAGKTGTTDNRADAWFVGMTPKLVAAVWHGHPSGRVPGAGFGGGIPATIFRNFMTPQLAGQEPQGWAGPPGWCNGPGQFLVPGGRTATAPTLETLPPPTAVINAPPTTQPPATTPPPTTPITPTTRLGGQSLGGGDDDD